MRGLIHSCSRASLKMRLDSLGADLKVNQKRASTLEVALLQSNAFDEFADDYLSKNVHPEHGFKVTEKIFGNFKAFVREKQASGDFHLEEILLGKGGESIATPPGIGSKKPTKEQRRTTGPLEQLKYNLGESDYPLSIREANKLKETIVKELLNDFDLYKSNLKEDIGNVILARFLPESMILERSLDSDKMVEESVRLFDQGGSRYQEVLGFKGVVGESNGGKWLGGGSSEIVSDGRTGAGDGRWKSLLRNLAGRGESTTVESTEKLGSRADLERRTKLKIDF